jgi:hypothetical protein
MVLLSWMDGFEVILTFLLRGMAWPFRFQAVPSLSVTAMLDR